MTKLRIIQREGEEAYPFVVQHHQDGAWHKLKAFSTLELATGYVSEKITTMTEPFTVIREYSF